MTTNGQLDPSTLRVAPGFAPYDARYNFQPASETLLSNLVTPATLQDYLNLRAAFFEEFKTELTYAEAYRSGAMQDIRIREHENGGPLAAPVVDGEHTSNHGEAEALDLRNNIGTKSSAEYAWMVANAPRFGFYNNVATEGWHWNHPSDTPVTSGSIDGAATGTPTIPEEDMPLNNDDLTKVRNIIIDVLRSDEFAGTRNDQIALQVKKRMPFVSADDIATAIWNFTTNDMPGKAWQVLRDSRTISRATQVTLEGAVTTTLASIKSKLGIK